MSLQAVQQAKTNRQAAKTARLNALKAVKQQQQYQREVENLSDQIAPALAHGRNHGVVYADSEDLLYKIIAIEVGLIEEIVDMQAARQHARRIDNQFGRRKHQQGDHQRLMYDAITLALKTGKVCKHVEPDSTRVALYLPKDQPPKWTVFFADSEKGIADYMPTKRELAIALKVSAAHEEEVMQLTGHDLAQLRAWGQQFI